MALGGYQPRGDAAYEVPIGEAEFVPGSFPCVGVWPELLGIHCQKDVAYADISGADPVRTKLDIYYHEDLENAPIVLYAHGGAWIRGDKNRALFKPAALVPAGYLFISMNYRFRPAASSLR